MEERDYQIEIIYKCIVALAESMGCGFIDVIDGLADDLLSHADYTTLMAMREIEDDI